MSEWGEKKLDFYLSVKILNFRSGKDFEKVI